MGRKNIAAFDLHFRIGEGSERSHDKRGSKDRPVMCRALGLFLLVKTGRCVTRLLPRFPARTRQTEKSIVQFGNKSLMNRAGQLISKPWRRIIHNSDNIMQRCRYIGVPAPIKRIDECAKICWNLRCRR